MRAFAIPSLFRPRTTAKIACALFAAATLFGAAPNYNLTPDQADQIIQKFVAKETEFAKVRQNYTYRQTARLDVLDSAGNPTNEHWEEVTDIVFDPSGTRFTKVVYAPPSTLESILMDPEDLQDMRQTQPFVLTASELPNYYVRYLGHQQVDEIGCYVFAIKPKKMDPGQRYFSGEAWVDDEEFQIVKTYGRAVGLQKRNSDHRYPKFESYRQQIDGKYWFPVYVIANSTLHFKESDVRIKQVVKYEDYKQFKSDVKIIYGDAVDDNKNQNPPQKKQP